MSDSRQRVRDVLAGEPTDRFVAGPLAVHYCAGFSGVSLRDYTTDARHAGRLRSARTTSVFVRTRSGCRPIRGSPLRPWALRWGSRATISRWVESASHWCRTREDVDRIPPPDVMRQGRCPLMIEALQRLVEGLHGRAFVVACFDQYPFSLACALMGMQQMMTSVIEDQPLVDALMERCSEYTRAYAVALARAGADMLSGGDSPAGLLGPQLYREFALPAEQRVIGGDPRRDVGSDFAAYLRKCAARYWRTCLDRVPMCWNWIRMWIWLKPVRSWGLTSRCGATWIRCRYWPARRS